MYAASHRTSRIFAPMLLALLCGNASAQMYRPILIPSLPGSTLSAALGVNDDGDVVGWSVFPGGMYHGFFYDRTTDTTTDIGNLGGSVTFESGARAINNAGRAVGVYRGPTGHARSFTWSSATGFADISFIPGSQPPYISAALGIGDNGHIGGANSFACAASPTFSIVAAAGWPSHTGQAAPVISTSFPCAYVGTIYGVNAAGQMAGETLIAVSGGTRVRPIVVGGAGELPTNNNTDEVGRAFDVSDNGWACGHAETRTPGIVTDTACVWTPAGAITNLNATQFSRALSINNAHDVVGWDINGSFRAGAVWFGATPGPVDLNTRLVSPVPNGLVITTAESISNSGFIAGRLNEISASARAVLLEPCTPGVVTAPLPQQPSIGGVATFSVVAMGAGTLTHQWRHDAVPLTDGPTVDGSIIAGSQTDTLTITGVASADQGTYDVLLTSACGTATSAGVALAVPPCTADFNGDGVVNTTDLTQLLVRFGQNVAPGSTGDINGDGTVNTSDLTALLVQFGRVCP